MKYRYTQGQYGTAEEVKVTFIIVHKKAIYDRKTVTIRKYMNIQPLMFKHYNQAILTSKKPH